MRITKIDAAEAQIVAAIRLYFADDHPVPVYALAAAAREVLTTIGELGGIATVLRSISDDESSFGRMLSAAHEHAAYFKHADRHPEKVLTTFEDHDARIVLFIATHDFGRVTGGMPIEGQVFEAWWHATQTLAVSQLSLRKQEVVRAAIRQFGIGLRSRPLPEQKRAGAVMIDRCRHDPALRMTWERDVSVILARARSEP